MLIQDKGIIAKIVEEDEMQRKELLQSVNKLEQIIGILPSECKRDFTRAFPDITSKLKLAAKQLKSSQCAVLVAGMYRIRSSP